MRKVIVAAVVALGIGVGVVAPVAAHHSPAAFDRTTEVKLRGTVKEFRWQNPHTWIAVIVKDEQGQVIGFEKLNVSMAGEAEEITVEVLKGPARGR